LDVIIFEDEHLLAANKPAGLNTHAPSPFAGEGLYEWLKNSQPSRASLAIIHRLDKETSGVMVFGKTTEANRSLTRQFERRAVRKKYILLTDRQTPFGRFTAKSWLARAGEKYLARPTGAEGDEAVTVFAPATSVTASLALAQEDCFVWEAEPATGKTHQIRVQAAARGFPILGDTLYGGTPAARVFLHAAQLEFLHPATGREVLFEAPVEFSADPRQQLRAAVIDPTTTNAFRLLHGAADGWPGLYVDRLGDFLLAQSSAKLTADQFGRVEELRRRFSLRGLYHKTLWRPAPNRAASEISPQWLAGETAPGEILARENGLQFALRLAEGYSVGLFLDQRENRRRLLTGYIAPDFIFSRPCETLNAFAYTCGFSVCAAAGGARVTSLDLSKKYLEWGRRNFSLNGLDPAAHDFIFGDAFAWFRRLTKQRRLFDLIILDPPTFSRSKEHGVFQAEKDFGSLVTAALPLLRRDGILLASTNAANFPPENFLEMVTLAVSQAGRRITRRHYAPQPPDFPVHRAEPAYLKTVWLRVA
jgi:23S rRNA (cytosine1962-C5)-methyltransferase